MISPSTNGNGFLFVLPNPRSNRLSSSMDLHDIDISMDFPILADLLNFIIFLMNLIYFLFIILNVNMCFQWWNDLQLLVHSRPLVTLVNVDPPSSKISTLDAQG